VNSNTSNHHAAASKQILANSEKACGRLLKSSFSKDAFSKERGMP
jgi:hypothetical protein